MKLKPLSLAVATTMTLAAGNVSAAPFTNYDTRATGMGGLSVATASIDAAPFSNPAMLAAGRKDEGFGLLATFGASVGDPDNLTKDIDDFQTAFNAYDAAGASTAYNNGTNKSYFASGGSGVAMGFTLGKWAAAVSYQTIIDAELGLTTTDGNPFTITPGAPPTTNAGLFTVGVQTTEIGLSLARTFEVGGMDLAVGLTPKMTTTSGGSSVTPLDVANPSNTSTGLSFANPESSLNLDAGTVLSLTDSLKAGLVLKNALASSIKVGSNTVNLAPQMRAGVSYNTRLFSVGADLDLTENDPLVAGSKSRYMIIGTELNAFDWVQLRAGYRTNLSKSGDSNIAMGMGFSPFGAHLDLAALYDPNNTSAGISFNVAFGLKF